MGFHELRDSGDVEDADELYFICVYVINVLLFLTSMLPMCGEMKKLSWLLTFYILLIL